MAILNGIVTVLLVITEIVRTRSERLHKEGHE